MRTPVPSFNLEQAYDISFYKMMLGTDAMPAGLQPAAAAGGGGAAAGQPEAVAAAASAGGGAAARTAAACGGGAARGVPAGGALALWLATTAPLRGEGEVVELEAAHAATTEMARLVP
eukprot:2233063-Prymnesium_polylepis.1